MKKKNILLLSLSIVCLAMFESPTLAAQKILVIEVVEENWDTLPGRVLAVKYRPMFPPQEYMDKREKEGKELFGCYEVKLAVFMGGIKPTPALRYLTTIGKIKLTLIPKYLSGGEYNTKGITAVPRE
ncbi:MAG: hypothetical protein L6420_10635 [Elusimicrobia bacterium]|nr:hypothetical protein [Elusimicrobiota bacterium]